MIKGDTFKIKGIPQSSTEAMRTRKHIDSAEDGGGCGGIVLEYNEVCQVQSRRRGISAKLVKPKYIEFQHCDEAMPLKNCPVIAVLGHNSLKMLPIRENGKRNTGNLCHCYLQVFSNKKALLQKAGCIILP